MPKVERSKAQLFRLNAFTKAKLIAISNYYGIGYSAMLRELISTEYTKLKTKRRIK